MTRLAWFFQTERRLNASLAIAIVTVLALAATVIGVRLSSVPERETVTVADQEAPYAGLAPGDLQYMSPAPLPSASSPTGVRRASAQQVAVEAVEKQGHAAGLTTIQAQDGPVVVVEVLTAAGPCTVALLQDAQSLLVDEVTCPPPS